MIAVLRLGAQQTSIFSAGINAQYGMILVHSVKIQNTAGARPRGIQLEATWQKIGQQTWDNCYCYPHMGFSLTWFDYNNKILGQGVSTSYFIEPSFRLYRGFEISLKGQLGLSWLSNPYDKDANPNNMSYSLPVTGYVGVGLGTYISIGEKVRLKIFGNYLHVSNGGIRDPNKGIDWPTVGIGLNYVFNPTKIPVREKTTGRNFKGKKPRIDVFGFATVRLAEIGEKRQYLIYGAGATISKQVGILSAITGGVEWHDDEAERELQRRHNRSDLDYRFAGIAVGHEFLLGKFIFSQQLGTYLYKNTPDFPNYYHRWGLVFRSSQHFSYGVNLKAYSHHVHFLDFRTVYSF
jgi:hypothetical protein